MFVLDNIKFSSLNLDIIDRTKVSHFENTSILKDGSLIENSVFLPSIVKKMLGYDSNDNVSTNIDSTPTASADSNNAIFAEFIDNNVDSISESTTNNTAAGLNPSNFLDFINFKTKNNTSTSNSIPLKVKVSSNTIIGDNNSNKNTIIQNIAIESKKGSTEDDF